MILSPEEQFFLENINKNSVAEQVAAVKKLRQDILELREKIEKNEDASKKSNYKSQLQLLTSYENYVITYFFKNRIFKTTNEKDTVWTTGACNFILACREVKLADFGLEDLVEYFTINENENDIKSYEKFDFLKKYNNKDINVILDCPEKTKLSYYKLIQQKLKEFSSWFNENREPSESKQLDECLKQKIELTIESDFKAMKCGSKFRLRDLLEKYNVTDEEMLSISTSISKHLKKEIIPHTNMKDMGLIQNIFFEKINGDFFNKLPYSFYLFYNLKGFACKLSPEIFAIEKDWQVYIIKDCKKLGKIS